MIDLFVVVGAALSISFICSVLEAVLFSISHSFVGVLKEDGDRVGVWLSHMREHMDEPIAAILTLNTIGHTVGAAMGGAVALRVFGDKWIALFSAVLTFAILIFSEIIPKTLGARYWKQLARPSAYVLRALIFVMKPIVGPLGFFNRLISPKGDAAPRVSRAELEVLAGIGRHEGSIDEEEWQVVTNIINLDQVKVGHVMTPRTSVVAIPADKTVAEAQEVMLDEGRLRLPVFEDSVDSVVGVLLARDLWRAHRDGVTDVREVMRPPRFVPASKSVEDLLGEMRSERIKMAVVLDEFGGTAGIVTLEDLIEEIVGEIHDEHESDPMPFEDVGENVTRIGGNVPVRDVNEKFNLKLPEDVADTIGGFVFGKIGRVASRGDRVPVEGGVFRVEKVEGRRVRLVVFQPNSAAEGKEGLQDDFK
ncbi:MAG: hemolysin family protein [Gemmatimonadota bacterium]|nr:hemolysin family protein [Gemmatimonadota bacterium]